MVARGPEAIPCAHCRRAGARTTCRLCGGQVCEACAVALDSCAERPSHTFRLRRGARLIAAAADGLRGLARDWDGVLHPIDLELGSYAPTPYRLPRAWWALLTGAGEAIVPLGWPSPWPRREGGRSYPYGRVSLATGERVPIAVVHRPLGRPWLSDDERFIYVRTREHGVELVGVRSGRARVRAPVRDQPVRACAYAAARSWLVVGTDSGMWLQRDDGAVLRFGPARPAVWVAIAGRWLAGVFDDGRWLSLHAFEIDEQGGARAAYSWDERASVESQGRPPVRRPVLGALAGRGGHLVLVHGQHRVAVHGLADDRVQWLGDHTDAVSFAAVCSDGDRLITADDDGRVCVRPWRGDRFADELDVRAGTARRPRPPR